TSTNVSDHKIFCNSSRVTTSPGRSNRIARTWKGCPASLSFTPPLRSSPAHRSTSKVANRTDLEAGGTCCTEAPHLANSLTPKPLLHRLGALIYLAGRGRVGSAIRFNRLLPSGVVCVFYGEPVATWT